jgi:hypothetical protein
VSNPVGVTPPALRIAACGQTSAVVARLPFANHVHKLDATQNDLGTTKVLEALYRQRDALDCTMVLPDFVEILALPDDDLGPVLPINNA